LAETVLSVIQTQTKVPGVLKNPKTTRFADILPGLTGWTPSCALAVTVLTYSQADLVSPLHETRSKALKNEAFVHSIRFSLCNLDPAE